MSKLAGRRLLEVEAAGRELVEATLKLPRGVGLVETVQCIARLKTAMAVANRRRADLGYVAVFHAAGRNGGGSAPAPARAFEPARLRGGGDDPGGVDGGDGPKPPPAL